MGPRLVYRLISRRRDNDLKNVDCPRLATIASGDRICKEYMHNLVGLERA